MGLPVDEQVILFTAAYTSTPPAEINDSTTLASLGIVGEQDTITYIMELEDSFELVYESGDEDGIVTVGDATRLIEKKLHHNEGGPPR